MYRIHEVANRADGVARFTFFDVALGDASHPHRVAVEVADDGPDLVGSVTSWQSCVASVPGARGSLRSIACSGSGFTGSGRGA